MKAAIEIVSVALLVVVCVSGLIVFLARLHDSNAAQDWQAPSWWARTLATPLVWFKNLLQFGRGAND